MFRQCFRPYAIAGALCLLTPSAALAQIANEPDLEHVRIRLGPLFVNPTLALTNAGIDDNIFNEPAQVAPKSDFTATLTPGASMWLRLGRTWLSGTIKEELVYYRTYSSERSGNTLYRLNWYVPLNRLIMTATTDVAWTRERPGYEIDTRAPRHDVNYTGLVEIRALSRTFFGVRGERRTQKFAEDATFRGTNLSEQLDRTETTGSVTLRHQLTPLTNMTVDLSRVEDRFDSKPERDTNSTTIAGGVKFDPSALLKGGATFGYRNFQPVMVGVEGYKGSIMAVDLTYTALDSTKIAVLSTRDVQYSYDISQPYYVQTGIGGTITQQIFGPLDVELRISAQRLEYRTRAGAIVTGPKPTDHVRSVGSGIGYRLGRDVRIAVNADQQRRTSEVESHQYDGLRWGLAITYGF